MIVEICCGSYYDALQASRGGAKRIELNSSLHLGGLTPSLGTLKLVKENTDLNIICMVRPRGAGFCYNDEDFEVMLKDCELLLENGADGIAFGCLNQDFSLDLNKNKALIDIIKKHNGIAVFHRAFDLVKDIDRTIKQLIDLGVNRILTSGLKEKAVDGKDILKYLQDTYGHLIEILPGSGINASNAKEIIDETNVIQIHSSCKDWILDPTTKSLNVSFGYTNNINQSNYEVVNKDLVSLLINSVK